jgi:hypothetical protein
MNSLICKEKRNCRHYYGLEVQSLPSERSARWKPGMAIMIPADDTRKKRKRKQAFPK